MSRARKVLIGLGVAGALLAASVLGAWVALYSAGEGTRDQVGIESMGITGTAPRAEESLSAGVADSEAPAAKGSTEAGASTPKAVIRTASIAVRVEDISSSLVKVRAAVRAAGGEITSLSYYAGPTGEAVPLDTQPSTGPKSATVVLRVPSAKIEAVSASLAKLGDVESQSADEQDVTQQVIDVDARLKNLRAEEARVRDFLDEARNVSDLLAVEQELGRLRGEIESLQAQADYLERETSMATLTLTLSEPAPVVSPAGFDWGLTDAVTAGIRAAVAIVGTTVTIMIATSPLIAAGLLIWLVVRAIKKRRADRNEPEATA